MKDWDNYQLILALHRKGTIRGAANLLAVNHSTVSRRLAILNKHSGGDVFERTAGGYHATPLGNELITAAEQIEDITIRCERRKRASKYSISGAINLSIPPPIAQTLLLNEFKQFLELYPEIQLNINSSFQISNLDRSEADIVIRCTNNPPEHLVGRRVAEVKLNYYAHRNYLEKTNPEDYEWIGRSPHEMYPEWVKNSPFPNAPIGIRSDDILMRHHFAMAGYGLTRGACYMADQEDKLICISNNEPIHYSALWVLTHPDLRDTPRIKILMQFLATALVAKKDLIEGKSGYFNL